MLRRPSERRQVDADQRAGRQQDRHHQRQAADHPARRARHREPAGRAARPRRHPGPAPAAHPARPAAQRRRARHPGRRRRRRVLRARPTRRSARATGSSPPSSPSCSAPVVAIVTKTDAASEAQVAEQLLAVSRARRLRRHRARCRRCPASRSTLLADLLVAHLPEGPQLYPDDVITDNDIETRIAELIREAALDGVRDELPHSIAVTVEEMRRRDDRRLHARSTRPSTSSATARRASSSAPRGARLKQHRHDRARAASRSCSAHRVHLDLHVAVEARLAARSEEARPAGVLSDVRDLPRGLPRAGTAAFCAGRLRHAHADRDVPDRSRADRLGAHRPLRLRRRAQRRATSSARRRATRCSRAVGRPVRAAPACSSPATVAHAGRRRSCSRCCSRRMRRTGRCSCRPSSPGSPTCRSAR